MNDNRLLIGLLRVPYNKGIFWKVGMNHWKIKGLLKSGVTWDT